MAGPTGSQTPAAAGSNRGSDAQQSGGSQSQGKGGAKKTGTSFKGESEDMKGHVFQLAYKSNNSQQFAKTIAALKAVVAEKFTNQIDILPILKEPFVRPSIAEPNPPEDPENKIQMAKWDKLYEQYMMRTSDLENNYARLYTLMWGQCSKALREKLKASTGYEASQNTNDVVWLLNKIKELCFKFEEQKYMFTSMYEAYQRFYSTRQGKDQSVQDYHSHFINMVQAIEHFGGAFGTDPALLKICAAKLGYDPDTFATVPEQQTATKAAARERYLAAALILGADHIRFGELRRDLYNGFMAGRDEYPADIAAANKRLVEYRSGKKPNGSGNNGNNTEGNNRGNNRRAAGDGTTPGNEGTTMQGDITLTQVTAGTDGRTYDVQCYNCRARGHFAHSCPEPPRQPRESGTTLFQINQEATVDGMDEMMFTQFDSDITLAALAPEAGTVLEKDCILLDSQSTISVVHWSNLLSDIVKVKTGIRVHTNGGYQDSNMKGMPRILEKIGTIWYNPDSIANIFSLAMVTQHYRVTMDTSIADAIIVHIDDEHELHFKRHGRGLYCMKLSEMSAGSLDNTNNRVTDYSFFTDVGTVAGNETQFTAEERKRATLAYNLVRNAGYINPRDLISHLRNPDVVQNSPITGADVRRALLIHGPMHALLKGKSVHHSPSHVEPPPKIPVPDYIRLKYNNIFLSVDYFHVNGNHFLHSISRHIRYRTSQFLNGFPNTKVGLAGLMKIRSTYESCGFRVTEIHADNAFAPLIDDLRPTNLIIAAAGMKAVEAERSIRVVRERVRCMTSDLPFTRVTVEMCKGFVYEATRLLDLFPVPKGVSKTLSPTNIITGLPAPNASHLIIRSGLYAQVLEHGETDVNHKSQERTVGAIALHQANPITNSWYFLSLHTWKVLHVDPHHWTILPMPPSVIRCIEERAIAQKQPPLVNGCPIFGYGITGTLLSDDPPEEENDENDDYDSMADDTDVDDLPIDGPNDHIDQPPPLINRAAPDDVDDDESSIAEDEEDALDPIEFVEEDRVVTEDSESDANAESTAELNDDPASSSVSDTQEENSDDIESEIGETPSEADEQVNEQDEPREQDEEQHEQVEEQESTLHTGRELRPSRERNYDHLRHPGEDKVDC